MINPIKNSNIKSLSPEKGTSKLNHPVLPKAKMRNSNTEMLKLQFGEDKITHFDNFVNSRKAKEREGNQGNKELKGSMQKLFRIIDIKKA